MQLAAYRSTSRFTKLKVIIGTLIFPDIFTDLFEDFFFNYKKMTKYRGVILSICDNNNYS